MTLLETQMVDLLMELREEHHVVAVKAEFEAEGTRMEEAMRLKEIATRAGLDMTIKIGGCEALKDMFEAACIGARYLVAPMVESPYALHKYLDAVRVAFPDGLRESMEFLINIETKTAVEKFDEMLQLPNASELDGIVIGRHDLTGSLGLPVDAVNSAQIEDICIEVAAKAKARGCKVVIGGAVSASSKPFFARFTPGHLDRFETRKIVFGCPGALGNSELSFLKAVEFEMLWLKSRKQYYNAIDRQNDVRLAVLEDRYRSSIEVMNRMST